ncbi:MAG: hypothetical protein CBC78_004165 [Candidatus Pelagibacter sp. TMED118]|nr:MAG: hypothetical protein CBC78_004165 [Candidatus Pelagibacter sp. TMED118]|tara:strand:+ start:2448 stop:3095 length:648 start_codon:yes stop_codon:yes gene_type:complete
MEDQEINIINNETRKERIKLFLLKHRYKIISFFLTIILLLLLYFGYNSYKLSEKEQIADKFNLATLDYEKNNSSEVNQIMKDIVNTKDKTYSPLALYFIIENNLENSLEEMNNLFDVIINETDLTKDMKYLNIYKKAVFNANFVEENKILEILDPLFQKENIWQSHSYYLLAEYYFSKDEMTKSKEFFDKILSMNLTNSEIRIEAQKRLQRDFSD